MRGPAWAERRSALARLAILVGHHVAAADMIERAHQPLLLHPLDQAGGAVISDAQLPLQPARRGLLAFGDDLARLRVHAILGAVAARRSALHREAAVLGFLGDAFDIVGRALAAPMVGDRAHLVVGNEGAVDAGDRSEEHTSELQSLMRISYAVLCLKKYNK